MHRLVLELEGNRGEALRPVTQQLVLLVLDRSELVYQRVVVLLLRGLNSALAVGRHRLPHTIVEACNLGNDPLPVLRRALPLGAVCPAHLGSALLTHVDSLCLGLASLGYCFVAIVKGFELFLRSLADLVKLARKPHLLSVDSELRQLVLRLLDVLHSILCVGLTCLPLLERGLCWVKYPTARLAFCRCRVDMPPDVLLLFI